MKYDIRTKHLECFLSAARTKSFTAAAKELDISRPLVSKWIKALEDELNTQLFERQKEGVFLTDEGRRLEELIREPFDMLQKAFETADEPSGEEETELRIGIPAGGFDDKRLLPLISSFKNKYPEYSVAVKTFPAEELYEKLKDGVIDVMFHTELSTGKNPDVSCLTLVDTAFCIAVSSAHRLAHHDSLPLESLKNERFFSISEEIDPEYTRRIKAASEMAGFEPRVVQYVSNLPSLALSIIYQNGVTIAPREIAAGYEGQIRLYPLPESTGDDTLALLWRKEKPGMNALLFAEYTNLYMSYED